MNLSNRALAAIIAVLLVLCCLTGGAFAYVVSTTMLDAPAELAQIEPTATRTPTLIPTNTPTRAPSLTPILVVPLQTVPPPVGATKPSLTPTQILAVSANPYNIIVPTPGAPNMRYPVTFNSTLKVVTYTVTGKTTTELSRALEAKAMSDPHESTGRYYAMTEWHISSDWRWVQSDRGCEMNGASVTVLMTMTLPALATRQGVVADVLPKWDTFLANGIVHEKGHVTRVLDGARDYQRAIGNLATQPNCNVMRPTLDNLFKQYLSSIDRANVQYDVETKHGVTQNAVFP